MKNQDIIKTIARLDGWINLTHLIDRTDIWTHPRTNIHCHTGEFNYLKSRDAILPVIEKQPKLVQINIVILLKDIVCRGADCPPELVVNILMVLATASQLCEALLRATGKWKD
jgi:hypothetical protein